MQGFKATGCALMIATLAPMTTLSSSAFAAEVGVEAQGGRVNVNSSTNAEVNKYGNIYAGSLFVRQHAWIGNYSLGLGMQEASIAGKNRARGVEKQDVKTRLPFAEARYLFDLPANFGIGLGLRDAYGKGANDDVQHTKRNTNALGVGPVLAYTQKFGPLSAGVDASYYLNTNVANRHVGTFLAGVSIAYELGKTAEKAPEPAPTPAPAQVEPVTQVKPVVLPPVQNMSYDLARFKFASSALTRDSRQALTDLGAKLAQLEPSLGQVMVAGHTDSIGPKSVNDKLSLARARAVCKALAAGGLAPSQLTCKGFAATQPLPNLPTTAAAQRRSTMVLVTVPATTAQEIKHLMTTRISH